MKGRKAADIRRRWGVDRRRKEARHGSTGPSEPPARYTPCPTRRDEQGFGLIELIVSLSVFSILMGGIVVTMTAGLGLARSNRERTVAANLASQDVDAIRQADFTSLVPGLSTSTVAVDGVNFTIARNLEWVNTNASSGECDSAGSAPQVLRATVDVSWTNMKTVQPVRTSTVLSPPVGSYDANLGHIAVRVRDRTAAASPGVPVRIVGPGTDQTLSTTGTTAASPGCAFFAFLTPGSYTVTLGTSGYVDRQGLASPSQTVGVNSGQVASVAFDYDIAASLSATITGNFGGTPANAMALTLGNTGFLPTGTKVFTGVGTVRTLSNLFPFVDGYTGWAGDCADADPLGKNSSGNRYWPSALRDDAFEVSPGSNAAVTVSAGTVQVNYTRASGSGTVSIIAVHGNDTLCPSGETLTIASFTTSSGSDAGGAPLRHLDDQGVRQDPGRELARGHARSLGHRGVDGEREHLMFRRRDERGQSSMVEIAATLMLLSIVLTVVYSSVDSAQNAITGEQSRLVNLDEARTLMDVTTKDIRTATRLQAGTSPFASGQDRDVTFYANLNNTTGGPRKLRIYVDSTNILIAQVWAPDVGSTRPTTPTRVLPRCATSASTWRTPRRNRSSSTTTSTGTSSRRRSSASSLLAVYSVR